MNYPESVQFLYALGNEVKTIKLGLERIRTLLDALGNPQRAYKVVHVAGTNGKGSVCAMIDAGLRAAGVRAGMFTSPHLMEPTERIQIDGMPVSQSEFERAFNVVHETAERLQLDMHPTYFETVTAMAFWLFRERGVETAVVEHRRTSDDRAVLVDDVGVAVENEFVLRADHVHVHDRAVRFAGPSFDKRAAHVGLAAFIRRPIHDDEQSGALGLHARDRSAVLPEVLADCERDVDAADAGHQAGVPGTEEIGRAHV